MSFDLKDEIRLVAGNLSGFWGTFRGYLHVHPLHVFWFALAGGILVGWLGAHLGL